VVTPAAERTARTPAVAGNGAGRHAAPEGDAAATTGVLPTVFGGGPTRRPTELQYSGPAEDGSTTRRRTATPPATGGRAAADARSGAAGEPARNRPCPCGSGRKYKHCHGAPTAAHS
jgi:preprotein translocase subunit SecA